MPDSTVAKDDPDTRPAAPLGFQLQPTERAGLVLGDRYEIRGFLSHGATSKVYLGHDLLKDFPVAVKILRSRAAEKPTLRERFEQEACIGLRVAHESVVRVLAAEIPADGTCYIVMEPLLGESLGAILRRGANWPYELRLRVARWAAEALNAVHAAGLVHRDVKPDNFFALGPPAAPTGLKLLDFGMATDGHDDTEHLEKDQVLGTAEYMAPEQILAEKVDARSDVYSFGVFLFRLFTEHLPFEVEHLVDTLRHQLFSPAPPPTWVDHELDPRLEDIILTALKKNPKNRYPSMDALVADLALLGTEGAEPKLRPPAEQPDAYVPTSDRGREALQSLAIPFGPYARLSHPS